MNHIEMYSSSSMLRGGLHRVLATSAALAGELPVGKNWHWWDAFPSVNGEALRTHTLSLEELATIFESQAALVLVNRARASIGLDGLNADHLAPLFRQAIISGRAHKAHGGRDVYGISNKALFDDVCAPMARAVEARFGPKLGEPVLREPMHSALPAGVEDTLRTFIELNTSPTGDNVDRCVGWLSARLRDLGFSIELVGGELGRPIIIARRPSKGMAGHVALYGHYDTTPFGNPKRWAHPPEVLTLADSRLHGRGVADNKGPLAARLAALTGMAQTPQLTWLIQGEEELGSPVAHALLEPIMRELEPTLWLEETGYHDHEDGTLRLLARTVGSGDSSPPPDDGLNGLLRGLAALATRWQIGARVEHRGLNKSVVEGGCPFNKGLPLGARYLAVGVNDSGARIHGSNESLPMWTFLHHKDQLATLFHWTHYMAGGDQ